MKKNSERLRCSFCGKSQDEVKKLIAGPTVYICNECIEICNEILDDDNMPRRHPESTAARHLNRARSDLTAAESLISLSHYRVAIDVARGSVRAAFKALPLRQDEYPSDESLAALLNVALRVDEEFRRLRDLDTTRLIAPYEFDDEVNEADARRVLDTARQIVEFVAARVSAE